MNDLNANLYDLSGAQLMLDALLPKQRGVSVEKKPQAAPNKYLDLSSINVPLRNPAGKANVEDVEKRTEEHDAALRDFDSWEGIIAWCMSLSRAETGFVVDSQGFVIASRGRIPSQGIEGVGAELVCSIEQLERIDPDAGRLLSVEIDFDKRRLVGFVAGSGEINDYVVGLMAPEPLNASIKHKIIQQIIHNLPHLD
jgi:hypothetical protein